MSKEPSRTPGQPGAALGLGARRAALHALTEVLGQGRSLASASKQLDQAGSESERALAQALCYGVLRQLPRLEAVAGQLLERRLKPRDVELRAVILLGLYQIVHLRTPAHAAVAESVELLGRRRGARGLANAVLRRFLREQTQTLAAVDRNDAARLAHPQWLLAALRAAWPAEANAIAAANNRLAPLAIRVNRRHTDREQYRARLADQGLDGLPIPHTDSGLFVRPAGDVRRLPGFAAGDLAVQDGAAQLAAGLLRLAPGQRVLDACAAPGGKTIHLLEREPALAGVTAVDRDAARLVVLQENLQRHGMEVEVRHAELEQLAAWWDRRPFDRVLLDAPCSALGVVRRHPDIKLRRRPVDVRTLAATQRRLLEAAWSVLAGGGLLLYATCSVLPEENGGQFRGSSPAMRMRNLSGLMRPGGERSAQDVRSSRATTTWTVSSTLSFTNSRLAAASSGSSRCGPWLRAADTMPPCLWALLLACLCCLLSARLPAASVSGFVIRDVHTFLRDGVYYVDADIGLNFSDESVEALANGVPLTIRIDMQVIRERRFWVDETVAELSAEYRLQLHALSKQYVVRNLNLGTSQSHPSLASAGEALGRISNFPLVDAYLLSQSGEHWLRLRAHLDIEALPAPLRPLAYLSSLWRLDSDWYQWPIPN